MVAFTPEQRALKYLVYSQDGNAGMITDWLLSLGFTNVYNLEGGFEAWVDQGYPTNQGGEKVAEIIVVAPDESIKVGAEFDVSLVVSELVNFDAGQFDMLVDDSKVELVSVSNGTIGETLFPITIWNKVSAGRYRFVLNMPGAPGVSGGGTLCILRLRAIGAGNMEISIENGLLNDNQAVVIPSEWHKDTVTFFRSGDANRDGLVDRNDIEYVARYIVGLEEDAMDSDIIGDGVVDTRDITALERMMAGL